MAAEPGGGQLAAGSTGQGAEEQCKAGRAGTQADPTNPTSRRAEGSARPLSRASWFEANGGGGPASSGPLSMRTSSPPGSGAASECPAELAASRQNQWGRTQQQQQTAGAFVRRIAGCTADTRTMVMLVDETHCPHTEACSPPPDAFPADLTGVTPRPGLLHTAGSWPVPAKRPTSEEGVSRRRVWVARRQWGFHETGGRWGRLGTWRFSL